MVCAGPYASCGQPLATGVRAVKRTLIVTAVLLVVGGLASGSERTAVIGAVYPTGGPQGPGGLEEFRGVELAAEYTNQGTGARGRQIFIRLAPADFAEAAPRAVERLFRSGITVVVGSYGSTISHPAAAAASRRGIVFWENGAVGELGMAAASGEPVFRFAPTGAALGRAAVTFVRDQLTPRLRRDRMLRYAVTYVDDAYGRSVAAGAIAEIKDSGVPLAATLPYDVRRANYDDLAARIAESRADVLVVAAYLQDGVALRWAIVGRRVPLLASIGTSSSYCHPAFGQILGEAAVGLFASDKPDADTLRPDRLSPEAARALRWARAEYLRRYGSAMGSAGLSGFAGGIALFGHVLPAARDLAPEEVARAARMTRLPAGTLPDGSGLEFAGPGSPDAGSNLRATRVIWEWIRPRTRGIVWPPSFATHPIAFP